MIDKWDDTKYTEEGQIIKVDHERWTEAQKFEEQCWKDAWHLQDDWNMWWKKQFDDYEVLEKNLPETIRAIEVGCGPFTNARLIELILQYKEISFVLSDPLMESYLLLPDCWVKKNQNRQTPEIIIDKNNSQLENLNFANEQFDLLVCINVLDHVEDVNKCFDEMYRVLKKDGLLVFGQDLTDWTKRGDPSPKDDQDQGHPVRVNQEFCELKLKNYDSFLNKIVESRNKQAHYGCLCYIGRKK